MIYVAIILAVVLVALFVWWVWHYYFKVPNTELNFAKTFFVKNVKDYKFDDIDKIKKIHHGYTNLSFYILMKDGKDYQLRFAQNNDIVDRKNERKVINFLCKDDYLYLDEHGNYIKKWVKGNNIKCEQITNEFIDNLKVKIEQFHHLDIDQLQILKHNYKLNKTKMLAKKYLVLYEDCLDKLDKKPWVISHNDLNLNNVLVDENNNIAFIDFEWTRINHPYWDIANFCRETDFTYQQLTEIAEKFNIPLKQFFMMYYVSLCYAYNWTFENSFSLKIFKYRCRTFCQVVQTYKHLKAMNN